MSAPWIVLVVALWAVMLLLVVVVLGLSRRVEQLQAGVVAGDAPAAMPPESAGPVVGERLSIPEQYRELLQMGHGTHPRLLLFMHSGCGPCISLAAQVSESRGADGQHLLSGAHITLVTDEDGATSFNHLGVRQAVVDDYPNLSREIGVPGTPYAVRLDATERVVAGTFLWSISLLRDVVSQAGLGDSGAEPALPVTFVETGRSSAAK